MDGSVSLIQKEASPNTNIEVIWVWRKTAIAQFNKSTITSISSTKYTRSNLLCTRFFLYSAHINLSSAVLQMWRLRARLTWPRDTPEARIDNKYYSSLSNHHLDWTWDKNYTIKCISYPRDLQWYNDSMKCIYMWRHFIAPSSAVVLHYWSVCVQYKTHLTILAPRAFLQSNCGLVHYHCNQVYNQTSPQIAL